MPITSTYQVLVGAGKLYIAPYGTTFPLVNAAPASTWLDVGETDGGIDVDWTQKIDVHNTDQRTGPVKATRSAEREEVHESSGYSSRSLAVITISRIVTMPKSHILTGGFSRSSNVTM